LEKSAHTGISAVSWGLLFALAFIWGSSFIMIKYALVINGQATLKPEQVGALRMVIASLSLLPITWRHRKWFRSHWKPLLIVGVFGNGLPAFLFAFAQTRIDSSLSGMLNSATPLFALLIGVFLFQRTVGNRQVIGVLLGLIGAVILIWSSGSPDVPAEPLYAGMAVLGSFCYAVSVNTIKSRLHSIPNMAIAGMALIFAGVPCGAYLSLSDLGHRLETIPGAWQSLASVTTLAIVATAFALVLFNKLVDQTDAVFSSSVTYLLPLVAIVWGVLDGEHVSLLQLFCMAVVIGGVILVSRSAR
jgi:drug/metabolite transporter (DMT)-like permease